MMLVPTPITEGSETFKTLRFHFDSVEPVRRCLVNNDPSEMFLRRDIAHNHSFTHSVPLHVNRARANNCYDMDEYMGPMRYGSVCSSYIATNDAILNPPATITKQWQFSAVTEGQEISNWIECDALNLSFADSPRFLASDLTSTYIPECSHAIEELELNDEVNVENNELEKLLSQPAMLPSARHDKFEALSSADAAQFSGAISAVTAFPDPTRASKNPPLRGSRSAPIVTTTSSTNNDTIALVSSISRELEFGTCTKFMREMRSSGACDVCGKHFFKSGALARHVRASHATLCNLPRKERSTSVSPLSNAKQRGGRIDCPRCSKTFSQQGSLNRHLRSIHEARKLQCKYCCMAFGQAFDLKRHHKRKHPGSVPFIPPHARPIFAML